MDRQHTKCAHHFILEAPNGTWSLGICDKCSKIDAFRNWESKFNDDAESKRNFLRSKGVKYWETYSAEIKSEVVQAASEIGIHEAARKFDIPISTVGLWAKGRSIHDKNSDKYTISFKILAIKYYLKERNFKRTARILGVPRSTLQSWARKAFRKSGRPSN